jgi:Na+/H+-dicarboxylate symporter
MVDSGIWFVMAFVFYPTLLLIFAKVNPIKFFRAPAQLLAFSTSSSATLPVTMECNRKCGS